MKVNLCVKEPKEFLNYKCSNFNVGGEDVNFQVPTLLEEVKNLNRKQKKEYKKIILSFLTAVATTQLLSSRSMASTSQLVIETTSLPSNQVGIPSELMEVMSTLLVVTTGVAVFVCIGMLILAGILRAMRKRKESSEWTSDIIKGLTQVIVSAPLVYLIYWVAVKLFAGSTWFINPFSLN